MTLTNVLIASACALGFPVAALAQVPPQQTAPMAACCATDDGAALAAAVLLPPPAVDHSAHMPLAMATEPVPGPMAGMMCCDHGPASDKAASMSCCNHGAKTAAAAPAAGCCGGNMGGAMKGGEARTPGTP